MLMILLTVSATNSFHCNKERRIEILLLLLVCSSCLDTFDKGLNGFVLWKEQLSVKTP